MKHRDEQIPLAMKIESFESLSVTNDKKNFITPGGDREPAKLSRQEFLKLLPLTVIDKETLQLIQVLQLHKAIDHTASTIGSAVLLRSLVQPGTDLGHIRSKQESLREIASDDKLRRALRDFVGEFSTGESALFKFFNKGLLALFPYLDLKRARKAAANIAKLLPGIPQVESPYLRSLMSRLQHYKGSPIDQMMTGSIYQTFAGLKSGNELGFFTPKLKFIPHRFTKWILAGPAMIAAPYIPARLGLEASLSPILSMIGIAWTCGFAFYSAAVKPVRDTGKFIEPFRARCVADPGFSQALDAIGMMDELLSCHEFAGKSPHTTVLPTVTDEEHHFFEATGLKNPVIAKDQSDFVPNNIRLRGEKLTFISGPNSGGKTTICKSIVHNQLLAQAGSYVMAEAAAINIADMISYQAPKFDGLQDTEGRFGTELGRTRDIFFSTGPKSLVILDELAEGTTYEERLQESYGILNDFYTIGNNTLLVTHNHSLVDRFVDEGKGQGLMVEFNGDEPTYRIIPGISRVSHAERVAERIRFSKEDRQRYLKEKGYL